MTKEIVLTKGKVAIVDDDDYDELVKTKWHVIVGKNDFYAVHTTPRPNQRNIWMHRVIMKPDSGLDVDHINGDGLDNRKSNLRICTRAQNIQNKKKHTNGAQRFKGVTYRKDNKKYQAQIMLLGKRHFIGCFPTDIEAAVAYDKKAQELFGQYAQTNF